MAEEENCIAQVHDLNSILVSSTRDFVVRGNGDQVKVESLKGKKIGLYLSGSVRGSCDIFTPYLVKVYSELLPKNDFEVVFISTYKDREAFDEYFANMPWLAVPFSDYETRNRLDGLFGGGMQRLVIIDENGKVLTDSGVDVIEAFGAEGYPFSQERIKYLEEDQEEAAKRNQTLKSLLVSDVRDYVLAADGKKVPVSELEGKMVGLYFICSWSSEHLASTRNLVRVYKNLKEKGHDFEIVMITICDDEQLYNLPWHSLPVEDKNCDELVDYFEVFFEIPFLVIIGPDGKTLHPNVAEAIDVYGSQAFPFTPERLLVLKEKAKQEVQTLESVLTLGEEDSLIGKSGAKIHVSDLVGYNILLFFDNDWDNDPAKFLPKLIETYNGIKAKDDAFEVIFVSCDDNQRSFDEFFSKMPWLAIPFGDERLLSLRRRCGLKIIFLPTVVAIDPSGKTVGYPADLIIDHGADAYPFTKQRRKELQMEGSSLL